MSTTSTQQKENMAAIGSQPIRAHHSSHVHASFLFGMELCSIRCKKLVQEKSCTRNHVGRSSFLYKSTCISFLYKFLDYVSPPLQLVSDASSMCVSALVSPLSLLPACVPLCSLRARNKPKSDQLIMVVFWSKNTNIWRRNREAVWRGSSWIPLHILDCLTGFSCISWYDRKPAFFYCISAS